MKIGIIGAGISGLSAAYELGKKGHEVVVFERGTVPGGLGTYIKIKGNFIERFYHHFFETDHYIRQYAKKLGIDKKLKFYRAKTGIFTPDNKIYPFSSASDLLRFTPLSFLDRIRCGFTVALFKFLPVPIAKLDTIPAGKWIKQYAGEKVYKTIWGPLLDGKFSDYAKNVPTLWLWGRIRDRSVHLGYFDGSVKILFDKLITYIEKQKGTIRLGAEITGVFSENNKVIIEEKGEKVLFDKVIITTVSPIANLIIKNKLPSKLTQLLSSIDHLGAVCLILELKHSIQSQYWLNICDTAAPVLVMVEHTNMLDKKYYGGRHVVYLANYIHRNDERFRKSDEEVLQEYTSILKRINPSFKKSWIIKSYISRVPRAQTIFEIGALKKIPPIELPLPNLYMINIDQMYPHDRNLNQGIGLGKKVTAIIEANS